LLLPILCSPSRSLFGRATFPLKRHRICQDVRFPSGLIIVFVCIHIQGILARLQKWRKKIGLIARLPDWRRRSRPEKRLPDWTAGRRFTAGRAAARFPLAQQRSRGRSQLEGESRVAALEKAASRQVYPGGTACRGTPGGINPPACLAALSLAGGPSPSGCL